MIHPTFPELARFASSADSRDPTMQRHVQACPLCQLTVAAIQDDRVELDTAIPISTKAPVDTPKDLEEGQVWRMEWDGDTAFGAIVQVEDTHVTILPVTEDPDLIPDPLIRWDSDESPLGFSAALWAGPAISVPHFVLDRYYATIVLPDAPFSRTPPPPYSDAAHALISRSVEILEMLSAQTWLSTEEGGSADWDTLLAQADLKYSRLAEEMELSITEIHQLRAGLRDLTRDQELRAAALLGIEPDQLPGRASIDPDLAWALDRPRFRDRIRSRAIELGLDEAAMRRQAARDLALARFRRTPAATPRDLWEQVVDDYFNQ